MDLFDFTGESWGWIRRDYFFTIVRGLLGIVYEWLARVNFFS